MSFRTTLVLLLVALAMGAYVWFYERDERPDPTKAEEVDVFDEKFESKDVQKLEISAKESVVVLERAGEAKWTLSAPPGARADKLQADNVADTIAGLKASRKLDAPASLAGYGLEKPAAKIDVHIRGKSAPRTILLGDKTIDSQSVYAKRADAAAVFFVPATLLSQVEKEPEAWRDRSFAGINYTEVVGLEVQREAGKLAFEKQGERWVMTEPQKLPASKEEVEALARDAAGIRVETFTKDGATAEELAAYGLDAPRYSVRLKVGATAGTQLLFGAPEPSATAIPETTPAPDMPEDEAVEPPGTSKKLFAKLADEGSVVLVAGTLVEKLDKSPEAFYFLQPFYGQQWQVQRAEIRLEEGALVVEKDAQGEWKVVEPEGKSVDYAKASGLLSDLFTVRFQGLAPEGAKLEEKAKIVLTPEKKGEESSPPETLLLGAVEADGTRLVQRQGEAWIYQLKDEDLGPLRTDMKGVLSPDPTPAAPPVDPAGATDPASAEEAPER